MDGLFTTLTKLKRTHIAALSVIIALLHVGFITGCSLLSGGVKTSANEIVLARILSVTVVEQAGRVSVIIESDIPLSYSEIKLSNPIRLVVDFPDAELSVLVGQPETPFGLVTSVRAVQFDEYTGSIARLEIVLKEIPEYEISSYGNNTFIDFFKPPIAEKAVEISLPSDNASEKVIVKEKETTEIGTVEPEQAESRISRQLESVAEPEIQRPILSVDEPEVHKRWIGKTEPEKAEIASENEMEQDVIPAKTGPVGAYGPGEYLEFVLKWAGIVAGDSTMSVETYTGEGKEKVYRIVSKAKSRPYLDIFYKVRNRIESYINPENSLTHKYVVNSREGGRRKERVLVFDQNRHLVTRIVREKGETISDLYEIPESVHDSLSSFYAIRDEELNVGDRIQFMVFEGRKNWELIVDVLAREEIKVRAGTFKTIKIHPLLKYEGIFRRKGELFVWVTDDEVRMPVLMKSKVKVGSIVAELTRYSFSGPPADALEMEAP
jgi:hypothetical protein